MEVITTKTEKAKINKVRKIIESTGNKIGSVWFKKRSDGILRKMSYRLHVKNPTYAPTPKIKSVRTRKDQDRIHSQMTVLDVNKVLRAKRGRRKGMISGRGDYRTIPLENVIRICVKGTIYRIK